MHWEARQMLQKHINNGTSHLLTAKGWRNLQGLNPIGGLNPQRSPSRSSGHRSAGICYPRRRTFLPLFCKA